MAYQFERDETVSQAFHRTTREQLEKAEAALSHELESDPGGAVHTARKGIKKERSLLRLMRDGVPRRSRRGTNAALRHAARLLSGARDADVMIATLDDLSERYAGQIPHTAFSALRERLDAQRHTSGDPATIEAAARQAAVELGAARARIAGWEVRGDGWRTIEGGLVKSYRRGIDAMERVRRDPDMENLHTWRKRAKDHWYHLRLLAPVCGKLVEGEAAEAEILCDLLGLDHDLAVLGQTLGEIGGDVAADVDGVLALLQHRRGELQAEAMASGARVYAERPRAFARRMRRCYKAGRQERRQAGERRPAELAEVTRTVTA